MTGDRDGIVTRIRQMRRLASSRERPPIRPDERSGPTPALEARVAHLERLVEGLQDSVHRESARHAKLIADLHAQIQPGPMGEALAKDARDRGL